MLDEFVGVGFRIDRMINGVPTVTEPIGSKEIEMRLKWLKDGDIPALEKARDAWLEQERIEREKSIKNQVKRSNYKLRFAQAVKCKRIAQSYQIVINKLLEQKCVAPSNQKCTTYPTGRRRIVGGGA